MNVNGLNMTALHRFLDMARIHLELVPDRSYRTLPSRERRNTTRLIATGARIIALGRKTNAPA